MSDFDQACKLVLGIEGDYSDDPRDPGGATKWGITHITLDSAIAAGIVPYTKITELTVEQAKTIYKALYWDKVKGDQLSWPLSLFMFDAAVNQGVDPAIRMLQKALNLPQDGLLGVQTLSSISKADQALTAHFMARRAMRYFGTNNFDKYGNGWLNRLFIMALSV